MTNFGLAGKERVVKGNVLLPVNSGLKMIVNVCGQDGKYDAPFDKELTKKWAKVRESVKLAFATNTNFKLGSVIECTLSSDLWMANLVVKDKDGVLNEKGLETAVKNLARLAKTEQASLHIPATLFVEVPKLKELVQKEAVANGVNLYVYEA